jgi:hypothetical protein
MFSTNISWPMTLTPTNEAIRPENHGGGNLIKREKNTVMIWEVMKDVRMYYYQKA